MSTLSTHVLDTSIGSPATGVPITLSVANDDGTWKELARGTTDSDGRVADLLDNDQELACATYRMTFDTATYFAGVGLTPFYPAVQVDFNVHERDEHYHIPLLLSPYGYSTYRGS